MDRGAWWATVKVSSNPLKILRKNQEVQSYTLLIPIPDVFVSVFVVYYFCMLSFIIYFLECLIIFENVLDFILKRRVCVNTLMSETILSFSKGSFPFAFIRQLSAPLGQL